MSDHRDPEAENRVRSDLWGITSLWDEMLVPSIVGGRPRVNASKEPPLPISAHILDVRRDVTTTLAFWAKVIHDERELNGYVDLGDVFATARLIETHVAWALDHGDLPGFADDVARLASDVRGIARPERKSRVRVGRCPVTVARDGEQAVCDETVWAYPERDFIRCPGCGTEDTAHWWRSKMLGSRERLVCAQDLTDFLFLDHSIIIEPATVRVWVHRGKVTRHGKDERGRWLYDWAQVEADMAGARWVA